MKHTEIPNTPSKGYISKLSDFHSLLIYRAERAQGPERRRLLAQANTVHKNIANCRGKHPPSFMVMKT